MTQALAAVFKIPTESPQLARGMADRARKAAAAQRQAASRTAGQVAGSGTRAATRGDGEVIELESGITVYAPRGIGCRWRAVWYEDGARQQCESVSEDKLAGKTGPPAWPGARAPSQPVCWRFDMFQEKLAGPLW
jgi:hypothetical protein